MIENKGWAFSTNGKKRHYYVAGESLCNRHEFYGYVSDFHHNSPSNCELCKEKLVAKHSQLYD